MRDFEKNVVYVNVNEVENAGFFVTVVMTVVGWVSDLSEHFIETMYLPTLDDGYILKPWTYHFWTEEQVERHIKDHDNELSDVELIP